MTATTPPTAPVSGSPGPAALPKRRRYVATLLLPLTAVVAVTVATGSSLLPEGAVPSPGVPKIFGNTGNPPAPTPASPVQEPLEPLVLESSTMVVPDVQIEMAVGTGELPGEVTTTRQVPFVSSNLVPGDRIAVPITLSNPSVTTLSWELRGAFTGRLADVLMVSSSLVATPAECTQPATAQTAGMVPLSQMPVFARGEAEQGTGGVVCLRFVLPTNLGNDYATATTQGAFELAATTEPLDPGQSGAM